MRNRNLIRGCAGAALAMSLLSAVPAHAGLFGESDEEKAARQHEKDQDAAIADLNRRVHDLEQTLSRATGDNEALSHEVQVLSDKLDRQKKDFEYRLCTISAQQLGAGQGDEQSSIPCGGSGGGVSMNYNAPSSSPPAPQQDSSGTVRLAPPPGVLGTLPAGARMANAAPAPASSSRAQFDAALNMLAKARYDDARAAFRSFADSNPNDELTPQAIYWIGDIAYVQKDYPDAARAFAEQIKKYPTSSRGPDSMLKLGQSLIAMGQTKEGCTTLGALTSKYPAASKSVTAQAAAERKTSCR
ncbi:MAG TPA: tol-pal system protein YbgF [Rhizomicrobium sp.]|jgi:tol-pal system protein YbgF|nr:tol-pal system protein YbgF [Rhizomicrobium sp.]